MQHNVTRDTTLSSSSLSQIALVQSNDFTQDSLTSQDQADTANRDAIVKIGSTVTRLEIDLSVSIRNTVTENLRFQNYLEYALVRVDGRDLDGSALIRDLSAANVTTLSLRTELAALLPRNVIKHGVLPVSQGTPMFRKIVAKVRSPRMQRMYGKTAWYLVFYNRNVTGSQSLQFFFDCRFKEIS